MLLPSDSQVDDSDVAEITFKMHQGDPDVAAVKREVEAVRSTVSVVQGRTGAAGEDGAPGATGATGSPADASALLGRMNTPLAAADTFDRRYVQTGSVATGVTGAIDFVMFTPIVTITATQISIISGTTISGAGTLRRLGLYTFDETTLTLVARTASDLSLLGVASTVYTRSFDTAGGYPASYELVAGERYAVAFIQVGGTMGSFVATISTPSVTQLVTPRLGLRLTGQTDLVTTYAGAGSTGAQLWARLS